MELQDVVGYAAGTALESVEQHVVVRARTSDMVAVFDPVFAQAHSVLAGNLFTLVKGPITPPPAAPRGVWPRLKRRIKIFILRQVAGR